jgi:hypothetical protein
MSTWGVDNRVSGSTGEIIAATIHPHVLSPANQKPDSEN